jgi:hypothetical protein
MRRCNELHQKLDCVALHYPQLRIIRNASHGELFEYRLSPVPNTRALRVSPNKRIVYLRSPHCSPIQLRAERLADHALESLATDG